jgi:3-phenylpropionate/cinnamic acid dioxygenase small subunit
VSAPEPADEVALRNLAYRYAQAVDRRDPVGYVSVFDPAARVHVYNTDSPERAVSDMTGHEQLAQVPELIKRFDRTYHFVGNTGYDVNGDAATGEVYCQAHHLTEAAEQSTDLVLFMRYQDTYRRGADGWRIVERRAFVDWTEIREAGHAFGAPTTVRTSVRGGQG